MANRWGNSGNSGWLYFPRLQNHCRWWLQPWNFFFFNFTILYWFCHTSKWICHGCTRVPNPEPSSLLPPHTIPLGHPSAPAPSIQYPVSNLDWRFVSYMTLYMFQCHSPKSSHPRPLPQSPKACSIHLCLFCCCGTYTQWSITQPLKRIHLNQFNEVDETGTLLYRVK